MLALEGLRIVQGAFELRADFALEAGTRHALIGPSGAGKSTLLLAIAGFVQPVAGRVRWQGRDLGHLPPGARPVSMLFQDQNLFGHLGVAQNLGLGLSPTLRLTAADRRAIEAALARVGLTGFGARRPGELSGGEQGRVALARVLLRARPILLLDEPFAALGPALKADMLALVREIAAETRALALMVTHDPADARAFAEGCILVADGHAHPSRPTQAFFSDPPAALRAYLGRTPS
jgi:thiamine transport system ATP-binding protein